MQYQMRSADSTQHAKAYLQGNKNDYNDVRPLPG